MIASKNLSIESKLCGTVQALLSESEISYRLPNNSLSCSLTHDLGIDSIMRLELFQRIEKQFDINLADKLIAQAETLQDIANAIQSHTSYQPYDLKIHETTQRTTLQSPHDITSCTTLQDVLLNHAENTPDNTHIYFLDEDGVEEKITYLQLLERAQSITSALKKLGIHEGEMVAIMLPSHPHFFYAFMGILLAGCTPVPIYPLAQASQLESYITKEATILNNAQVSALITFQQAKSISQLLRPHVPSIRVVKTAAELLQISNDAEKIHRGKANDYALIQYTSGSTSNPKGILLTHRNLISNIQAYGKALQVQSTDVTISWLPLYHDLGLIGLWLGSLYFGIPFVVMSPLTFITRPEKWLLAIHRYRGTLSAGPNFAYELCTKKIDSSLLKGLDLSTWRMAINGAELVQPETLHSFYERFKEHGFKEESFMTVYGLAESSLGLTTPPIGRKPKIDIIDRHAFEMQKYALPSTSDAQNTLQFVSCGNPMDQHAIRIVNEAGAILPERQIGQIQFSGPSTMLGYYNNPEATQAVKHGEWTDSGDLGYICDNELYVTGRIKDLIIKAGRNYCTTEIESVTGKQSGIRKGCVIAFGTKSAETGTEKLIVVAETNCKTEAEKLTQKNTIRIALQKHLDVTPDEIILVKPRTIPKTSSGKLQRSACKTLYLNNTLHKKNVSFKTQLVKLITQKFLLDGIGFTKKIAVLLYSLYTGILFTTTLLPVWLAISILPHRAAYKVTQYWIKSLTLLLRCPVTVSGLNQIPTSGPAILAINHASYIDVLILMSTLPNRVSFIGKSSLFRAPIIRTFLRKFRYISINKNDMLESISDLENIRSELQNKKILLAFPEGTFTSRPGLRPFKLGIFKLAAEMNIPIIPLALKGTRKVLKRNSVLLHPSKIELTIGYPIPPIGKKWHEIHFLKDQVRIAISNECGEVMLFHS